ncbi:MAG: cell division protein FtsQ/DivIB [Pseudomonadota bacterium]
MSKGVRKTQSVRRGKASRPKSAPRRTTRGPSLWRRILAAQPLPPTIIRRVFIALFLVLFVLIGWQAAEVTGVNAYVRAEGVAAVGRAGFTVRRVEVVGANRIDRLRVYDIALNHKDRSMAALDLDAVRAELLQYGWVADARVSRRLPDTLVIDLVERSPVAVWQNRSAYMLIDNNGRLLPGVDAATMPGLPILVGQNAPAQMRHLQALLDAAPALRPQISGASWIGNRRWDLHFKTGETLALPDDADRAKAAFVEFARMDGVNRLLGRGIQRFDMRIADRFVLRPGREGALGDLENISGGDRQVVTTPPTAAHGG